jgi:hypothetical protein
MKRIYLLMAFLTIWSLLLPVAGEQWVKQVSNEEPEFALIESWPAPTAMEADIYNI